jgi:hypothetical protein
MGVKMEMKLIEGEKIVLEGGAVTLTNKRLVTLKKKSFFNFQLIQDKEIFLDDIDEAHNESGGFGLLPTLNVKLKNGECIEVRVAMSGGDALSTMFAEDYVTDTTARQNAVNERWANAINNQLRKHQIEQLSKSVGKCHGCGKEIPQGNYAFCPSCGISLKP